MVSVFRVSQKYLPSPLFPSPRVSPFCHFLSLLLLLPLLSFPFFLLGFSRAFLRFDSALSAFLSLTARARFSRSFPLQRLSRLTRSSSAAVFPSFLSVSHSCCVHADSKQPNKQTALNFSIAPSASAIEYLQDYQKRLLILQVSRLVRRWFLVFICRCRRRRRPVGHVRWHLSCHPSHQLQNNSINSRLLLRSGLPSTYCPSFLLLTLVSLARSNATMVYSKYLFQAFALAGLVAAKDCKSLPLLLQEPVFFFRYYDVPTDCDN